MPNMPENRQVTRHAPRRCQYALDLVRTICSTAGPGLPGSRQERQRAEIIRSELASRLGDRERGDRRVRVGAGGVPGRLSPRGSAHCPGHAGNVSVPGLSGAAAWLAAAGALGLPLASLLALVREYILYHEFVDPSSPRAAR